MNVMGDTASKMLTRQQFSRFTPSTGRASTRARELPRRLHIDLCGMHVSPPLQRRRGTDENFPPAE